ncbi:bifunctional folylpolyglutamate synthase/dihydrofolate synthase [Lentibacillus amyloliquefaciens]|uniref:tetrahydrofolate synthase n=1 Tax=Lentibacillus amyloliquefaciens TaxID=1472767 RepID=A0A0U4F5Z0_9BACI|nr:cyanophycin synthetase [Lentibacillus amyloliquefaciens]ALX48211.1 hypothetical protein AOX59_06070 [Lentibacillus amyloliquefaciens]
MSIITNVEWDHTDFLGKTVKSIASHKAGIIKENRPVVAGEMSEEAMRIITGEAFDKNAPLYQSGEHFWCKMVNKTTQHQTFEWLSSSGMRMDVKLKTAGSHQIKNASLAVMTLTILQDEGFDLDWDLCAAGVADVKIPGRFEQVHSNPPIILDAAHNVSGVHAFTETLTDDFYDMEKHLIFAVFKDKDFKRMLEDLGPHFTSIILTTFDHPRAADPEQLQKYCDHPDTQVFSNWQQAAEQINLKQKNKCYCVTGSLHFIAIMRKYFEEAIELQ